MCGKPNPDTAEVCAFCQARLRPLSAAPSEPEAPVPASGPPEEQASDWLAKLRAQGALGESGGTRDFSAEAEPLEGPGEVPSWLARIRARNGEEEETRTPTVPPPSAEQIPQPAQPETSVPSAKEEEPAEAEEPEWLKRLRVRRAYEQDQEPEKTPFGEATSARGEELPPDWLHVPREEGWGAPTHGTPSEGPAKGPAAPGKGETPSPPPSEVPPPSVPSAPFKGEAYVSPAPVGGESVQSARGPKPGLPRLSPFTQGSDEFAAGGREAEIPDWLARAREAAEPSANQGEPTVGQAGTGSAGPGLDELLAPGVLPEWLTTTQPSSPAPQTESAPDEIEQAILPPWLQALRPIEGPAVKAEGTEEERVETAGPLSGLKGILPPVSLFEKVPHPPVQREQLEVNPTHAAQAELLQRVVLNPESREAKRVGHPGRRLHYWTWGVWALLFVAILVPGITQSYVFARPTTVPVETLKLRTAINALPDDRPILMAFEYDPADAAELEAGALAVIDQLMGRGIPIASLSTRPAGPAMAADVMARGEAAHPDYAAAGKYLPLGYLPGDAVGLRAFANDPRKASGAVSAAPAWDSAFLQPVTNLEGFSSIIIVVAQPQLFQAWVEQVHTLHPTVPVFAVISAAAEPLARPYYENDNPSVEGLVVGLAGAETYDCMDSMDPATGRCGNVSPADTWWDPFGASVLAAVLVLGVGAFGSAGMTLLKFWGGKKRD